MLFVFLTTIGASLILQQKIRQECEGPSSDLLDKRKALETAKRDLTAEQSQLSNELRSLLAEHRSLVSKRDGMDVLSPEEYEEAMEELERDLSRDPLDVAFDDLEEAHAAKKKKSL